MPSWFGMVARAGSGTRACVALLVALWRSGCLVVVARSGMHSLMLATSWDELLLDADPMLDHHAQFAGAVLDFSRGNERFLTSN